MRRLGPRLQRGAPDDAQHPSHTAPPCGHAVSGCSGRAVVICGTCVLPGLGTRAVCGRDERGGRSRSAVCARSMRAVGVGVAWLAAAAGSRQAHALLFGGDVVGLQPFPQCCLRRKVHVAGGHTAAERMMLVRARPYALGHRPCGWRARGDCCACCAGDEGLMASALRCDGRTAGT